ncbi:hypothetical protein K469DRAFT_791546 [Zopfia rhizophila CBS 207.26]|uniref:Uncharacterized protein n=1 Tax=Zopfia rhizophila CBS 207.26 TaxID=1314779 RepID=A0A6A6DSH1_9PEZI|nr:hypothetical protein K469DRAFT_791546 [Zopfia rhizophila CBS 207.26]
MALDRATQQGVQDILMRKLASIPVTIKGLITLDNIQYMTINYFLKSEIQYPSDDYPGFSPPARKFWRTLSMCLDAVRTGLRQPKKKDHNRNWTLDQKMRGKPASELPSFWGRLLEAHNRSLRALEELYNFMAPSPEPAEVGIEDGAIVEMKTVATNDFLQMSIRDLVLKIEGFLRNKA